MRNRKRWDAAIERGARGGQGEKKGCEEDVTRAAFFTEWVRAGWANRGVSGSQKTVWGKSKECIWPPTRKAVMKEENDITSQKGYPGNEKTL